MTTAVCLWVVAGISMAVGVGLYLPALAVTLAAMFSLLFIKQVERYIKKERFYMLVIYCSNVDGIQESLRNVIEEKKMRIVNLGIEKDTAQGTSRYEFNISTRKKFDQEAFVGTFTRIPEVKKINLK